MSRTCCFCFVDARTSFSKLWRDAFRASMFSRTKVDNWSTSISSWDWVFLLERKRMTKFYYRTCIINQNHSLHMYMYVHIPMYKKYMLPTGTHDAFMWISTCAESTGSFDKLNFMHLIAWYKNMSTQPADSKNQQCPKMIIWWMYRLSRNFSEDLILALLVRLFSSLKLCIANNTTRLDIIYFII